MQKAKTNRLSYLYGKEIIMPKITCKKAKYFEKDEKKSSKEYKKLGLRSLSKDESNHRKFFKRKIKEIC